nr:glycosyltransferase family protein [Nitrospirota bacterium]
MPTPSEALQVALRHHTAGNLAEAEQIYRGILASDPRHADALHLLGVIAHQTGRDDLAAELIAQAIALNPSVAEYHNNLGNALKEMGRPDEAVSYLRQALALKPEYVDAHYNLGNVLNEQDRLEEAIECYRYALSLKPQHAGACVNLGNGFRSLGRISEALDCYRQALRIEPDFVDARWNRACALLLSGNLADGWNEYECRWELERARSRRRNFPQPLWDGSDISGRNMLLHAEQGIGDTLQFVRYAPLVAKRGARVVLECHPALKSLLETVEGVAQVVSAGEPLPEFDLHSPLLSLPRAFRTTLETIPKTVPYVRASRELVRMWKEMPELGGKSLKVGVAWAGGTSDPKRDCGLSMFASLAKLEGVQLYSLQKGEAAKQAANPSEGMALFDLTAGLNDFADTAALISHLDLVISIDTAVAHLAGAMGRPVWTLLRFAPDWRWMLAREDSPWYPTMRLFRQEKPGDWSGVFARVTQELHGVAKKRRA